MNRSTLLTSEQYLALPGEFDQRGNRIKDELIGGQIVRMPPPSHRHDRLKNWIKRLMDRYLDRAEQRDLECLVATGARAGTHDTFVPDVSVVRRDRFSDDQRILQGAPDLAIEVVSPDDRPAVIDSKVEAYLAGGANAVWLIHAETRSVTIRTRDATRTLSAGQQIHNPLLPGFSIAVSEFFEL